MFCVVYSKWKADVIYERLGDAIIAQSKCFSAWNVYSVYIGLVLRFFILA